MFNIVVPDIARNSDNIKNKNSNQLKDDG